MEQTPPTKLTCILKKWWLENYFASELVPFQVTFVHFRGGRTRNQPTIVERIRCDTMDIPPNVKGKIWENHRLKSFKSAKNRRRFESLKREFSYEDELIFSKPHRIHWTAIFTILTNLPLKNSTIHVNQYIYILPKPWIARGSIHFSDPGTRFLGYTHIETRAAFWGVVNFDVWCAYVHTVVQALGSNFCIVFAVFWTRRIFILFLECKNDNGKSSQSHFSLPGKLTI